MSLTFLALAVLSFSCAAGSRNRAPNLANLKPEQIQAKVARNFSKMKSFDGRARVIIELPGEGYNGTSRILVKAPDSVYIKTEAILGIDIGALFLDARNFGAYAPRENVLYYGEVEKLSLSDFLQVEIETEELLEALTGLTPLRLDGEPTLKWDGGKYLVTCQRGPDKSRFWVDPKKFVVTKSELLNKAGQVVLLKEFKRLKVKSGIVLPQTIKITRPLAKERLTVYYTSMKLNKEIAAKDFKLKTSRNAKKVYWGEVIKRQTNDSDE